MGTNFSSPKVGVDEVRKGPPTISGKGATVGGFLGVTRKGKVNVPFKVIRTSEAIAEFGDRMNPDDSSLIWDVDLFFRNGGSEAWINRVAHSTADYSAGVLVNATPATAIDVVGSSEGTWADGTTVQTIRRQTQVGMLPDGATVTSGAKTSLLLQSGASRLRKGDLFRVRSTTGGETDTLIGTVTGVNGNTVYFASTSPTAEITVLTPSDAVVEILTFDMIVRDTTGNIIGNFVNLRMSPTSINFVDTVVEKTFQSPVTAEVDTSLLVAGFDSRPTDQTIVLAGGADGFSDITDADYIGGGAGTGTGLNAFDSNNDFDMLSVCGVRGASEAVVKGLLDYAELRKSFMAIVCVPKSSSRAAALAYTSTTVNVFTRWAEGYWMPWLKVLDPETGLSTLINPTGARQGVIARTHLSKGKAKAAGGSEDGKILGILGLESNVQEADYDLLYPARINAAQSEDGYSFNGNVTLDPTGEVIESGIGFYLLLLKKAMKKGLSWTKFEFNTPATRAQVVRNVNSKLLQDWKNGQLDGKNPSEAFFVVCEESNNDPAVRASRKMKVQIGVNVAHASEFIDVSLELDTRALDATLATAGT